MGSICLDGYHIKKSSKKIFILKHLFFYHVRQCKVQTDTIPGTLALANPLFIDFKHQWVHTTSLLARILSRRPVPDKQIQTLFRQKVVIRYFQRNGGTGSQPINSIGLSNKRYKQFQLYVPIRGSQMRIFNELRKTKNGSETVLIRVKTFN